ncbi:hypothetical protein KQX54_018123 [Cotesia glomerata]|uniref:BTB domain-containing protein n=1 Tax=Cotesia glomerata TaxID=32391 RepID=A0AAV7IJJ4_COTGL|nr:hypothetical protein KQX54_018123 [Cotesia glomerata]
MSLTIDEKKDNYVKVTWSVKLCEFIAKFYHSDQFGIDNIKNVSFKSEFASINVKIGKVSIKKFHLWSFSCCFKDIIMQKYETVDKIIPMTCDDGTRQNVYELKITCEINWTDSEKSSLCNNPCDEVERFYNSEELCDVTIIVDQVRIPAHKVVLATHSEVFAKMLQSEMKEAKNNEINIEDLDPEIILEMLHYCYKGTLKTRNDVQIVLQVLKVADIYQIIKLKEICEYRLIMNMSTDNVLNIIDVADDHNAVNLRQEAIEFIVDHYETVFASDKFKELFFRKQEMMFEVVRALSNK